MSSKPSTTEQAPVVNSTVPTPEDFDKIVPDSSAEQHTPQVDQPETPALPQPGGSN